MLVYRSAKVYDDDEYQAAAGRENYYTLAHTVNEKVEEQASIMVNGKLKEYQVLYFLNQAFTYNFNIFNEIFVKI